MENGHKVVIEGMIYIGDFGDNSETLMLWTRREVEPLARAIDVEYNSHFPFWSVRYFVSDQERHGDEWTAALIGRLYGESDVDYYDHYSDLTGYLWTDEDFNVGGHDLLDELRSLVGKSSKWLRLEITMHDTEKDNEGGNDSGE